MILTPSRITALQNCPAYYNLRYRRRLVPTISNDPAPTLGTLFHAAAAAYDEGRNWRRGVADQVEAFKEQPTYLEGDEELLECLSAEVETMMLGSPTVAAMRPPGGYVQWREEHSALRFERIETTASVMVGEVELSCRPDLVLTTAEGTRWAADRKVTERDDAGWLRKWRVATQTTTQVIAVAAADGKEVQGAVILQTLISRARSSKWCSPMPQPLIRIEHCAPRYVPKSDLIREELAFRVGQLLEEIDWRAERNQWVRNPSWCNRGYRSCEYYDWCWFERNESELVQIAEEDQWDLHPPKGARQ